ncbi:MAG: type VI secretion system tube protein Hcp [Planctomycetota bacterium]|nr:type VI secretion system tube protein Hcp [Planctomycetaceae bacterium]MDQ3333209.1 type VI secretion system tube protein Hcp [Planctomycetota bacterium]
MAVDMFIKIDGIDGESKDSKHEGEIDVLAWSWGVSQSGTMHGAGGGGAGKANYQDLSFTMWKEKAAAALLFHCASGKHIKEATLVVRKAGEDPLEYLKIKMSDILVSSVSAGGSGGEDRLTMNVSLNFAKIEYEYQEQNAKGKAEGGPKKFGWDIKKNEKV